MVEFFERVGQWLIVVDAVAIGVDGQVNGLPEVVFIGNTFACHVETWAAERCSGNDGQTGEDAYAVFLGEQSEGGHRLVVVNSQCTVELSVEPLTEIFVGNVWSIDAKACFVKFFDSRLEDGIFFFGGFRVDLQQGKAGIGQTEVETKTLDEGFGTVNNQFFVQCLKCFG